MLWLIQALAACICVILPVIAFVYKPWSASASSYQIPGPFLARYTSLWKIFHVLRGTYSQALLHLHQQDNIVRVGPSEYSYKHLHDNKPLTKFIMAQQLYDHEAVIDECNVRLLSGLLQLTDKPVRLDNLISCYAWDIMGATTVGRVFGFMDGEAFNIIDQISTWDFHSILWGTFFRFHHHWVTGLMRSITTTLRRNSNVSDMLDRVVNERLRTELRRSRHLNGTNDFPDVAAEKHRLNKLMDESLHDDAHDTQAAPVKKLLSRESQHNATKSKLIDLLKNRSDGARTSPSVTLAALIVVGSDPIARHILATLYCLARHNGLISSLREELDQARLSHTPTLQEIIDRAESLPLLRAVLFESHRLRDAEKCIFTGRLTRDHFPKDEAFPEEGSFAWCEQAANRDKGIFGATADEFMPERWTEDVGPRMAAFGLTNGDGEVHQALVAKLIVQLLRRFDIALVPDVPELKNDVTHASVFFKIAPNIERAVHAAGIPPDSLLADQVDHVLAHFGSAFLITLMEAAATVSPTVANKNYAALVGAQTAPITDKHERRALHEAIYALSQESMESKTDHETNCVSVGLKGFSGYRRYGPAERGQRGGRGRGSHRGRGQGRGRGRGQAQSGRSRTEHFRDLTNTGSTSGTNQRSEPTAEATNWNNFSVVVAEKDRASNLAARARIEAERETRKTEVAAPITTFKRTSIVDGVRTTVQVTKNGEVVGGGALLPQETPSVRGPVVPLTRADIVPPHRRAEFMGGVLGAGVGAEEVKDQTFPQNRPNH